METIEDILREMRSIKGGQHTNGGRSYEIWRMLCKVADDYADRIEVAAKELRDENAKLKAELTMKYQRCYYSRLFFYESKCEKLKAALKPVLDFDFDEPRPGSITFLCDATKAIAEAQRIYNEGA